MRDSGRESHPFRRFLFSYLGAIAMQWGYKTRIKVQRCNVGNGRIVYRALVCGGLRIPTIDGEYWNRNLASEMLDLLAVELPNMKRSSIKFIHE